MATKMKMRAVFNCSADEPGEISFKEGDILIDVEESGEDGWYIGTIENSSERGLFPYNYVERISNASSPKTANITIPANKSSPTTTEKTSLPGFPALDAFELAMSSKSFKSASSAPSISNHPPIVKPKLNTSIKRIATPPTISEKPMLSPTRSRSYSASTALSNKTVLKPSQLVGNTKGALELALSKGPPPPPSSLRSSSFSSSSSSKTSAVPLVGLFKSPDIGQNDVEDEDGYQMVKPSQLRQRQQQQVLPQQMASTSSKPVAWKKPALVTPKLSLSTKASDPPGSSKLDLPSSNPMPRLPSRPVSTASRRSRQNHRSSSTKTTTTTTTKSIHTPPVAVVVKEIEKTGVPPPILKPKPVLNAQPSLPPRPVSTKSRSTSNPPPIQPKPTMSSIEILLSKNAEKRDAEPARTGPKPLAMSQQAKPAAVTNKAAAALPGVVASYGSRPSLDSWRSEDANADVNLKPSSLLNRARSATNPSSNTSVDWSTVLTKPKSSSVLKPHTMVDSKPIKKAAPPPPPSRSRNKSNVIEDGSRHRYEILFDSIQDDGYVDGETARFIWLKSKLSNEELGRVWKECDPDHKGLLDKHAFIDGMGRIDAILLNKQTV
ncbi:uncharacterized protein EV154DRAFT_502900 [Mucor mucedo]|uniref:uncharacterized protein n=1 Tax=Mucor mucedo TaxID=29922 RepID=UPI00221EC546|nr:uncharacterized protein EV154DRAFT_502900 [Mucor mucedo]KAI7893216.1 hypothetical protein EV154DRAFT_502900 [Mucor mucedo]